MFSKECKVCDLVSPLEYTLLQMITFFNTKARGVANLISMKIKFTDLTCIRKSVKVIRIKIYLKDILYIVRFHMLTTPTRDLGEEK